MKKEDYTKYVKENLPQKWRDVLTQANCLEYAINKIAEKCFEWRLSGSDLYAHLYLNDLITAADWDANELDKWVDLNNKCKML